MREGLPSRKTPRKLKKKAEEPPFGLPDFFQASALLRCLRLRDDPDEGAPVCNDRLGEHSCYVENAHGTHLCLCGREWS